MAEAEVAEAEAGWGRDGNFSSKEVFRYYVTYAKYLCAGESEFLKFLSYFNALFSSIKMYFKFYSFDLFVPVRASPSYGSFLLCIVYKTTCLVACSHCAETEAGPVQRTG